MRLGGGVCLQGMGQGINTGEGGDMGRQADGQFRVKNSGVRIKRITVHPALGTGFFIDKHGSKGHFRAGSGRGGDHDLWHTSFFDQTKTKVVNRLTAVGDQDCYGLGHIHGRAAASADHTVATRFFGNFAALISQLQPRLRINFIVNCKGYFCLFQRSSDFAQQSGLNQSRINNKQYVCAVEILYGLAKILKCAGSELNTGGLSYCK